MRAALPEDILRRIRRDGSLRCITPGHYPLKPVNFDRRSVGQKQAATKAARIAEVLALIDQGWALTEFTHVDDYWGQHQYYKLISPDGTPYTGTDGGGILAHYLVQVLTPAGTHDCRVVEDRDATQAGRHSMNDELGARRAKRNEGFALEVNEQTVAAMLFALDAAEEGPPYSLCAQLLESPDYGLLRDLAFVAIGTFKMAPQEQRDRLREQCK